MLHLYWNIFAFAEMITSLINMLIHSFKEIPHFARKNSYFEKSQTYWAGCKIKYASWLNAQCISIPNSKSIQIININCGNKRPYYWMKTKFENITHMTDIIIIIMMSRQGNTWMFKEAMILLIWLICISSDLVQPLFPEVRNRKRYWERPNLINTLWICVMISRPCQALCLSAFFQDDSKSGASCDEKGHGHSAQHTWQELINHCYWKVHQRGLLFTFFLSISCSIQWYISLRYIYQLFLN